MNAAIIFLAGAIGLAGCATPSHYHSRDTKFPPSSPSDESGYQRPEHAKLPFRYVRDLPPEAEAALAKVGIKNIAFLAAVNYDGTMHLLKPENVKYTEGRLPVKKVKVTGLKPITILAFEGSECVVLADGSPGKWVDAHSEGGMWITAYCAPGESPF